jgi:hypothetical protein
MVQCLQLFVDFACISNFAGYSVAGVVSSRECGLFVLSPCLHQNPNGRIAVCSLLMDRRTLTVLIFSSQFVCCTALGFLFCVIYIFK